MPPGRIPTMRGQYCERCKRPRYPTVPGERHGWPRHKPIWAPYDRAAVYHAYYGCDTGCCGYRLEAFDAKGQSVYSEFLWVGYEEEIDGEPLDWAHHLVDEHLGRGIALDVGMTHILPSGVC